MGRVVGETVGSGVRSTQLASAQVQHFVMSKIIECFTWWTFRIFFIFSCLGKGKGESEAPGWGGDQFYIENPKGGREAGRGRGAGGCLRQIGEFQGVGGGG